MKVNKRTIKLFDDSALYTVYHIAPKGCHDTAKGYIGITRQRLAKRLQQHTTSTRPVGKHIREYKDVHITPIARLPLDKALEMEYKLRPEMGMGWNHLAGGGVSTCVCTGCGKHLPHVGRGHVCFDCSTKRWKPGFTPWNAGCTEFILTSPNGEEFHVSNLTIFCKDNGLTRENLRKVARGERNHSKGWKARFKNPEH